ncbi:hypothetical protein EVA_12643 [gut metagenome]|uniref:Uncharacterized protein n=1 Tax=gut metagenome TaxID=749906 RepID=J9GIB9_9ZZZZ
MVNLLFLVLVILLSSTLYGIMRYVSIRNLWEERQ